MQPSEPMLPSAYRVRRITRETANTVTTELVPQSGAEAVRYTPGQFNMLYVFGVGEAPISISGDPAERGVIVHTTRGVGPVSRAICAMKRNAMIGVR
ncbi:MAG TPA: Ni/Fe hydrogenase subunit gamma, partial [Thermoanaerobaculia bacterium]|nr:Ni/Fe hydrogenase subunit gamma [Thermoanaerobaculia bacterium]